MLSHSQESPGETALVAHPRPRRLKQLWPTALKLAAFWLRHPPLDHVQGVDTLRKKTVARVIELARDSGRLPRLDHAVVEGM